jgi:hypothetical protein
MPHVLREQAASVGDIFAQAVTATVSKAVSKPCRRDYAMYVFMGGAGEPIRTADRPLTRSSGSVANCQVADEDGFLAAERATA